MAYRNYLNKLLIVYRARENVQDTLGDVVEAPFVVVGTYQGRARNLSGNQINYLERNTTEDFERIYSTKNADIQPLDVVAVTETDGTVIQYYSIRRIVTPERTRRRHHTEYDAVAYDLNFTLAEAEYPTEISDGFNYTFNFDFTS